MARRKLISPEDLAAFMERASDFAVEAHDVEDAMRADFRAPLGPILEHARTANAVIRAFSAIQVSLLARLALEELRRDTERQYAAHAARTDA